MSPGQIAHFNSVNSFGQNGTYYSYCSAAGTPVSDGFEDESFSPSYQLITSAACGSSDPTIPIYVGESYCDAIQVPVTVYTDLQFPVTCVLDSTATTQPNGYQILVDGVAVKT